MELEAIIQALLCLLETPPNYNSIVIATVSMAVLVRIRNGWLPDGWHMDDIDCVCSRISFMHVPGIAINETADLLAISCKTPAPLQLDRHHAPSQKGTHEGTCINWRYLHHTERHPVTWTIPTRCQYNQLFTRNLSPSIFQQVLHSKVSKEKICAFVHPQRLFLYKR